MTSGPERIPDFEAAFREFVMREQFPCLGARATMGRNAGTVRVFGSLGDPSGAMAIRDEIARFGDRVAKEGAGFQSLIAVFPETPAMDEIDFDERLWQQLQQVKDADSGCATGAHPASDDPNSPEFSFSINGTAYFVVGLCPASSRVARRFTWPTLVFNPHAGFERLRAEGKYERFKKMIRDREVALQGSLNPNLADFGERSEARQYSGMDHAPDWKCPFHGRSE